MVKDTKKTQKINLAVEKADTIIDVSKDVYYHIYISFKDLTSESKNDLYKYNLVFKHKKKNISSDISLKILGDSNAEVEIFINCIAEVGAQNVSSKLSINGLLINEQAKLTVVPALEINDNNVSVDHQSSIGAPNIDYINYLSSKGLSREEAISLIAENFLNL